MLDLETLGSWPIKAKSLPGHWMKLCAETKSISTLPR